MTIEQLSPVEKRKLLEAAHAIAKNEYGQVDVLLKTVERIFSYCEQCEVTINLTIKEIK